MNLPVVWTLFLASFPFQRACAQGALRNPCTSDSECSSGHCSSQLLGYCTPQRDRCEVLTPPETQGDLRDQFLDQFQPCGWYAENCDNKAGYTVIEANVAYAGYDNPFWRADDGQELDVGNYIVQFDIGLNINVATIIDSPIYNKLKADHYGESFKLDDAIDIDDKDSFKSTLNYHEEASLGETCIELPAVISGESLDWGNIFDGDYDCMGKCGPGCNYGFGGYGKNCMKHDVCSAFKSILQEQGAGGFCFDVDCGDEAAQTVHNCWEKKLGPDKPVECFDFDGPENRNYLITASFGGQAQYQQAECSQFFSGWWKDQGLPNALRPDGQACLDFATCQSTRCDWRWGQKRCMTPLNSGDKCNEDNDCYSSNCQGSWWQKCE